MSGQMRSLLKGVAIILMIVCFFYGAFVGKQAAESYNYYRGTPRPGYQGYRYFSMDEALKWWGGGLVAGIFIYAIAKRDEQKHKENEEPSYTLPANAKIKSVKHHEQMSFVAMSGILIVGTYIFLETFKFMTEYMYKPPVGVIALLLVMALPPLIVFFTYEMRLKKEAMKREESKEK